MDWNEILYSSVRRRQPARRAEEGGALNDGFRSFVRSFPSIEKANGIVRGRHRRREAGGTFGKGSEVPSRIPIHTIGSLLLLLAHDVGFELDSNWIRFDSIRFDLSTQEAAEFGGDERRDRSMH